MLDHSMSKIKNADCSPLILLNFGDFLNRNRELLLFLSIFIRILVFASFRINIQISIVLHDFHLKFVIDEFYYKSKMTTESKPVPFDTTDKKIILFFQSILFA